MNPMVPKIAGGAAAGVAAVAIAVAVLAGGGYRDIIVEAFNGTSDVTRSGGEQIEPYRGLQLASGDDVVVGAAPSDMMLAVDSDKHLYAEAGTHFWLEAEGSEGESLTTINMDAGATEHWLEGKLNSGESYEVATPSATMSVRGTIFRVEVYTGADGDAYTLCEVFEGTVEVALIGPDGQPTGDAALFDAGEAALVRANAELTEFVLTDEVDGALWETAETDPVKATSGGAGVRQHTIPYRKITAPGARVLVDWGLAGASLPIAAELLEDYAGLVAHRFDDQRVLRQATAAADGEGVYVCSVCGEEGEHFTIPKLEEQAEAEPADQAAPSTTAPAASTAARTTAPATTTRANRTTAPAATTARPTVTAPSAAPSTAPSTGTQPSSAGGYSTESEPAHVHTVVEDPAVAATCTEAGLTAGAHCSVCGEVLTAQTEVAALGHAFGEPEFTWETDGSATATRTCTRDASHAETVPAAVTSEITTQATCLTMGTTTYTAAATFDGQTYTATRSEANVPTVAHTPVSDGSGYAATCVTAGRTSGTVCSVCGERLSSGSTIAALGHDWDVKWEWSGEATAAPTATAYFTCKRDSSHTGTESASVEGVKPGSDDGAGATTWIATMEFDGKTYTDTYTGA